MRKLLSRFIEWIAAVIAAAMPAHESQSGLRIEVDLDGFKVIAREMTVIEIRNWLRAQNTAPTFDLIDRLLFAEHDITVDELVRMSTATRSELERYVPSELVKLIEAVKQANPFFFRFRSLLANLDRAVVSS